MRKEFKNAKAKHDLNSKKMEKKENWHEAKHDLITKAKISFGLQNRRERELKKRRGEGEKRRREEKEKKKKKKRREEGRRKRSSRKIQRYGK